MIILKPKVENLVKIREILDQWTDEVEAEKYEERVANEISGKTEFNMKFFVAMENGDTAAVGGISDPLPAIREYAQTQDPGEIKILYADNKYRGKGMGKMLLLALEDKAREAGYEELLVRSAARYETTAYGFYEKMGYERCGDIKAHEGAESMAIFRKKL